MTKGIDLPTEEAQKIICKYIPVKETVCINCLHPWDKYHEDCKITAKAFIQGIQYGLYTDEDGYGVLACKDGYSGIKVYPSSYKYNTLKHMYPYVCWFNK